MKTSFGEPWTCEPKWRLIGISGHGAKDLLVRAARMLPRVPLRLMINNRVYPVSFVGNAAQTENLTSSERAEAEDQKACRSGSIRRAKIFGATPKAKAQPMITSMPTRAPWAAQTDANMNGDQEAECP